MFIPDKDGRYLVDIIRDELGLGGMIIYLCAVAAISLACIVAAVLVWL